MILRRPFLLATALLLGLFVHSVVAAPRSFEQEPIPAAPRTDRKYPASIEAVRFGFDGYLLSDTWAPVRVYVSGNPAINSGAFEGTVSLEFAQDASQSARITSRIVTTPGRIMPTEIIAAIPLATASIRVELRDPAGRVVDERMYWRMQFGDSALPACILKDVELGVVLADKTGMQPSIARALRPPEDVSEPRPSISGRSEARKVDERLACCVVREEELPVCEYGYLGAAFVAARSDVLASLALPKANSLAAWVRSGGCLVVLAGAEPQSWLQLFWQEPPLDIESSSALLPDPAWHTGEPEPSGQFAIAGRALRLTTPVAESGWRIDWPLARTARHDGEPLEGLLAQGPVGFGWIVVVGVDPALLGQTSSELTYHWTRALRNALAEASMRRASGSDYSWRVRGSGSDAPARLAIRTSLDKLTDIPALGDGAFIAIVAFLILLATAIGPFDAIVLRRMNLRAWSWVTALGWILIASVLAAVVPPLIRSGASTSNRLRVNDRIQTPDQNAPFASTALTSLFSSSGSSISLFDPGRPDDPPIGWFRGVSAAYLDEYGRSQPLSTFETFEAEFRPRSGKPVRINSPHPPRSLSMSQWTLRSFMNESAAVPPSVPTVRVTGNDGDWIVEIQNPTGTFAQGAIRVGTRFLALHSESSGSTSNSIKLRSSSREEARSRWDAPPGADSATDAVPDDFQVRTTFAPGTALELPGPRERSRAVNALIASGGWACVYLFESSGHPSLIARAAGSKVDFVASESTVWRILVPLAPEECVKPQPLPAAELKDSKPPRKTRKP
ncbi:MAG: hypothetical protein KF691_14500 [Phycisphaeraceae bacterium]|nr:hypothetical protein [Phycisphaeraceae bacterium]